MHLTHSAIAKLSIGHIVNVASTDVQRFDLVHIMLVVTRTVYVYMYLVPIGISVYSFLLDIPCCHASDGVFAVERTGSQLFSWCRPHTHPATTAICYSTVAHPIVVCVYTSVFEI